MKLPKSFGQLKKPKLYIRRVSGDSMLPAYKPGQIVIGAKLWRSPSVGNVVILNHNGLEKIKRITETKNGELYVLGDNKNASTDSRQFGWLSEGQILAKIIWPRQKLIHSK